MAPIRRSSGDASSMRASFSIPRPRISTSRLDLSNTLVPSCSKDRPSWIDLSRKCRAIRFAGRFLPSPVSSRRLASVRDTTVVYRPAIRARCDRFVPLSVINERPWPTEIYRTYIRCQPVRETSVSFVYHHRVTLYPPPLPPSAPRNVGISIQTFFRSPLKIITFPRETTSNLASFSITDRPTDQGFKRIPGN